MVARCTSYGHPTRPRLPERRSPARPRAIFLATASARSGSTAPLPWRRTGPARMFGRFRPKGRLQCEHMFCSPRTSKLTQRARDALALARAFLLLEDGDPVDWEVGREELAAASMEGRRLHEPAWVPAHRASPRVLRAPRRGGQPVAPPQVCLCPKGSTPPASSVPRLPQPRVQHSPFCIAPQPQRGTSTTTGSSRLAIDS